MRFATYGRKSVYSDKSDSVDNQQRMCREYVELKFPGKIDRFEVYQDEGFTGANTDRPGLERLLEDIKDGFVDALIVYQLDRISRDIRDFANIYALLEEKSVMFISIKENIDTTVMVVCVLLFKVGLDGLFGKLPLLERSRSFFSCENNGLVEQKVQMSVRFVEIFGTNSIRKVVFIAAASLFRRFRLGFRFPFSNLLMSA